MEETKQIKDETVPGVKWAFDDAVTAAFGDMLERSIPQYEVMRKACYWIGRRFVQEQTSIVDLGCSLGEAIDPFISEFGARNFYVGAEVSEPMLAAVQDRFKTLISAGLARFESWDLRHRYPPTRASLTLSILTAQFIPIEYRASLFERIYEHTVPQGAVILVEKILGESSRNDRMFVDTYLSLKAKNGYSQEQIERKRLSLEGVLVPVTAKWNEDMLRWAGFKQVECFWRWMNFAAWIGVKS